MRIIPPLLIAALVTLPIQAQAGVNVDINVGLPVAPLPPPIAPRVTFRSPPLFLAPGGLGFYVGVDMPYDLMLVSGTYYLFQGNRWYRASSYNGPWMAVRYDLLPAPVRQHRLERIRSDRDREYRRYREEQEHYRGRPYRPGRDGDERRYGERREYRDEVPHWDRGEHRGHRDHGRDDD